jgi:hypothetical protein
MPPIEAPDESLPNTTYRKHPRKGEKKKQGVRTKCIILNLILVPS